MRRSETAATVEPMPTADLTFPKTKRLTNNADFTRIREQGRVFRGPLLAIGTMSDVGIIGFRAGFITSRKIGGAVVRNRVRRRLRDIVRRHQRDLRDGISIVVIARRAASCSTYRALEDEWLRLAKRASILARS